MAYESFTVEQFEHPHETAQFNELDSLLKDEFDRRSGDHMLIGNLQCNGFPLDALFIKKNTICVIEMKAMGGEVIFRENGKWRDDIKGGAYGNPYLQVSQYRWGVKNKLKDFISRGALQEKSCSDKGVGHVSGIVYFGQEITLDNSAIPYGINNWFDITDPGSITSSLSEQSSQSINFSDYDFQLFREEFAGLDADNIPENQPEEDNIKWIVDRDTQFLDRVKILKKNPGKDFRVAHRIEEILKDARAGGDPLQELTGNEVPEIEYAYRYTLLKGYSLVGILFGNNFIPIAIGHVNYIDDWIKTNKGVRYVLNDTGKVTITYIDSPGEEGANSEEESSLLDQIDLELDEFITKKMIRKVLLDLNGNSSDEDIDGVIELIDDNNISAFLSDVLYRLKAGDIDGAEARLELWKGEAVDLAAPGTDPVIEADNFVDLETIDEHQLEKLLSPDRFAEWMVFLHPDQLRIAQAEYSRPVILTGISGSGKTCILAHRAKVLSERYPDEKIGVLTLNRNLSSLIKILIKERCGGSLPKNIEVLAFFDYFKRLVDHFGPDIELANLRSLAENYRHSREIIRVLDQVENETYAREFDPLSNETIDDTWEIFKEKDFVKNMAVKLARTLWNHDEKVDHWEYLKEEFSLIRSAILTENRDETIKSTKREGYKNFERKGRGIPIPVGVCFASTKRDIKEAAEEEAKRTGIKEKIHQNDFHPRFQILELLLLWEETMLSGGILDELSLTLALIPHLGAGSINSQLKEDLPEKLKFRSILVDEYQDLSTLDITILRYLNGNKKDGLMFAGDPAQHVMVKDLRMAAAGFDVSRVSYEKIKKNYRNSRQILKAASRLSHVYGSKAKETGHEIEILDPELAVRETPAPVAQRCSAGDEIKIAWQYATELFDLDSMLPWSICIVTADPKKFPVSEIIKNCPGYRKSHRQLINVSINSLGLHQRVENQLKISGIESLAVLVSKTERELFRIRNFGRKNLNEVKEKLEERGLFLGMSPYDRQVYRYIESQNPDEINAQELSGNYRHNKNAVCVSTMPNVKGFDFSHVIIVGCGTENIPPKNSCAEESWRHALRLYVAMTRARDEVRMIYSGYPSPFLAEMSDDIEWKET